MVYSLKVLVYVINSYLIYKFWTNLSGDQRWGLTKREREEYRRYVEECMDFTDIERGAELELADEHETKAILQDFMARREQELAARNIKS